MIKTSNSSPTDKDANNSHTKERITLLEEQAAKRDHDTINDKDNDTSQTSSDSSNDDDDSSSSDSDSDSDSSVSSSSSNDDDDDSSIASKDDDLVDEDDIPLFKYARLIGSLPHTNTNTNTNSTKNSPICTTSSIGKGSCSPPPVTVTSHTSGTSNNNSSTSLSSMSSALSPSITNTVPSLHIGIANPQTTPQEEIYFHVCAMGFQNGTIFLMDVQTGLPLLPPGKALSIVHKYYYTNVDHGNHGNHGNHVNDKRDAVISLSFDSSGKYLAAGRHNGEVLIFELQYHYAQPLKEPKKQEPESLLSSFFSSSTTNTTTKPSTSTQSSSSDDPPYYQRTFDKANSTDPIKCSYATPISNPILTCLAIDPSYSRRREKSHIVGFHDGRILLTKQGFFGRFTNTSIYNGSDPIETLDWRGNLVVWADQSGIKLYDVQQGIRLARIDRPNGARASLYPSISILKPYLYFERSDQIVLAWGDCVMALEVVEQQPPISSSNTAPLPTTSSASMTDNSISSLTKVSKPRKVICTMAWELDCIACGVQSLDEHHLAILGMVPNSNDNYQGLGNTLELQIFNRDQGTVVSADVLELQNPWNIHHGNAATTNVKGKQDITNVRPEAASGYSLLSSFSLSRMEDDVELEDEELITPGAVSSAPSIMEGDMEKMLNPLGSIGGILPSSSSLTSNSSAKFIDSHLRWSITNVTTRSKEIAAFLPNEETDITILLNKPKTTTPKSKAYNSTQTSTIYSPPPIMIISTPYDSVLVRTRNIDDSIAHYRSKAQPQLALSLGIQHRPILRLHSLSSLIQEYFTYLLNGGDGKKPHSETIHHAARMMPMLIGGNVEMWERWITQFAKVDGGLFALRDFIPVRDPKLSPGTYEMILNKMILEIEKICEAPTSSELRIHAAKRFYLSTLMAWGPIPAITERFQLLSHRVRDGGGSMKDRIAVDLFMRMQQTSKRYLKHSALMLPKDQFESWRYTMREGGLNRKNRGSAMPTMKNTSSMSKKENMASLYNIEAVTSALTKRLPIVGSEDDVKEDSFGNNDVTIVLFEAVAELQYISRNYHESLRQLLVVGAHFASDTKISKLEEDAVNSIVSPQLIHTPETQEGDLYCYEHIFAMIEYHNLHRYLLVETFISNVMLDQNQVSKQVPPIVALFRLVGHKLTGNFLMKHCSLPSFHDQNKPAPKQTKKKGSSKKYSNEEFSSSYLPLTDITKQLENYPRLLFWYLHLVFVKRPELYVNFPNTSVAPSVITDLHQKHFQLLMEYSVEVKTEYGGESKGDVDSPIMSFLKSALRHTGVRSIEARQMLESRRSERMKNSSKSVTSLFARELAYVIERSSLGLEEDAKAIIELHLEGSKSLPLAVAYAERNTKYSSMLWDKLVSYCLTSKFTTKDGSSLFQALLEAAAQCGADLAHLVSQIPEGMNIEGLRPMLLAAVADYRLKLKMHEASVDIMSEDKVSIIREVTHKTRKGLRALSVWDEKVTVGEGQRPQKLSLSTLIESDKRSRKDIKNHKMRLRSERQARARPIHLSPIR